MPRGQTKTAAKREWFVNFAHAFYQEFGVAFGRSPHATWRPALDETAWMAYARADGGREVATPLPHNFGWFRPEPVARSVVTRLIDQLGQQDLNVGSISNRDDRSPRKSRQSH